MLAKIAQAFTHKEPIELRFPLASEQTTYNPDEHPSQTVLDPSFEKRGLGLIHLPYPCITLYGEYVIREIMSKFNMRSCDPTKFVFPQDINGWEVPLDEVWTQQILVPYMHGFSVSSSKAVMHPIVAQADQILRSITAEEDARVLQNKIWSYYQALTNMLAGKNGLIRQEIYETRMQRSLRSVCVPDSRLAYNQVGISEKYIHLLQDIPIEPAYALLDREPNLWDGSVQVLKVRVFPELFDAILVNPYSHRLSNTDFDGDAASLVIPPHTEETIPELQRECGRVIKDHSKWSEEFLLHDANTTVNWKRPRTDFSERAGVHFTLSPKDLLNIDESEYFQTCLANGAKKVPEDLSVYAHGVDIKQFISVAEETTLQLTRTKREIGVVGAMTDKIVQLVSMADPDMMPMALRLKERISQLLLDSKSGTDAFDSHAIQSLFEKSGQYKKIKPKDFLNELVSFGFDEQMMEWSRIILPLIWPFLPLSMGIIQFLPQYQVARSTDYEPVRRLLRQEPQFSCVVDTVCSAVESVVCTPSESYPSNSKTSESIETEVLSPLPTTIAG